MKSHFGYLLLNYSDEASQLLSLGKKYFRSSVKLDEGGEELRRTHALFWALVLRSNLTVLTFELKYKWTVQ